MSILWDGGNLQWWNGKLVFCNPAAGGQLCAEVQCSIAGVGTSGYRVLVPCGNLNLNISGIVANDPEQCQNCTTLNDDWEIAEDVTCGAWTETFIDPLTGNCNLIDLTVSLDLGVCCDDTTDEIVLYADFRLSFGVGGVSIRKELERQPVVDGKCYVYDWSNPTEAFDCATADVTGCNPALPSNVCTNSNCDFSSATFTLTAA